MESLKITPDEFKAMKGSGEKIPCLTAYDYPTTRLLDEAGIPLILVGDSLGMVILGYPDTTHVTMEEMEHHIRASARVKPRGVLVGDLPYQTYRTPEEALRNAHRFMDCGADAVKAEGGRAILPQVKALIAEGIPVFGHLGMLPQSVKEEGGYKIKGKKEQEKIDLIEDAKALADAGVFGIVLELVTPPVAAELTRCIAVPTIGIGSGPDCDGQILVSSDLFGLFPWFTPKFVKPKVQAAALMKQAVAEWKSSL
ncbi:MAG: 3-methyl-2-oxobutanoate hydroxymethyltransferase [Verrucomicrobiales bacterium]